MTFLLALSLILSSLGPRAMAAPAVPPTPPGKLLTKFQSFAGTNDLYSLLRRHSFQERHIQRILKRNLLPKGISLAHGESYRVRKSPDGSYAEIKIYEPIKDRAYSFWRKGDLADGLRQVEKLGTKLRRVEGRVAGSILGSIQDKVANRWTAHRFLDAYTLDFSVPKTVQRGARFSMVFETKWDGNDMIGYGEIRETALEVNGKLERRHFISFPGGGSFVNPDNLHQDRPLYSPVNYQRLSSLFEKRRRHPVKGRIQPHLGIDFELHEGEDVFAAQSGVVLRVGHQRASGNFIVIQHNNGMESYYNHLRWIASEVRAGSRVINGQKIGEIGCTGYCTKAHLHFAVKKRGQFVDPIRLVKSFPFRSQGYISQSSRELPTADL